MIWESFLSCSTKNVYELLTTFVSLDNLTTATFIKLKFHSPPSTSESSSEKDSWKTFKVKVFTERKQEQTFCFVVFKRSSAATKLCVTRLFRLSTEVDEKKIKPCISHRIWQKWDLNGDVQRAIKIWYSTVFSSIW